MQAILNGTDRSPTFEIPLSVSNALRDTKTESRSKQAQVIRDSVAGAQDSIRATKNLKILDHRFKHLQSALHSQTVDSTAYPQNRVSANGTNRPAANGTNS